MQSSACCNQSPMVHAATLYAFTCFANLLWCQHVQSRLTCIIMRSAATLAASSKQPVPYISRRIGFTSSHQYTTLMRSVVLGAQANSR